MPAASTELLRLLQQRSAELCELERDPALWSLFLSLQMAPLRRLHAWAVPTSEALDAVAAASPNGVVEAGAGTGFWAHALRQRGVSVAPYDVHAGHYNGFHSVGGSPERRPAPPFTRVRPGDAVLAVSSHPRCTALLCWPPPEADQALPARARFMASDALTAFRGNTLVYVGEAEGGASAGPRFHENLRAGWRCTRRVELPQWPGASDSLSIWQRGPVPDESASRHERGSVEAPTTEEGLTAEEEAAAAGARQALLAQHDASWHSTAAWHIAARVLSGGPRARPGVERAAVDAAVAAAPLRRLLLRLLC